GFTSNCETPDHQQLQQLQQGILSTYYAMSSSSSTSSAPKTAPTGPRPSAPGTASARLAAQPGHPQGTSSPVASSTLREISGSGTD
ncbi:unnamed protein product, partial [Ascophyllum nodosum]